MSIAVTTTITMSNGAPTDAVFRAWGLAISTQLAAAGMVLDHTNINWATVLAPGVINTAAGYEVWRFADALQATFPVFFKLEYGSGAATTGSSMWITFASGTSGGGVMTGITTTRQQFSNTTAAVCTAYFCGSTNRFCFVSIGTSIATAAVMMFERSVDVTGTITNEAVLILVKNASAYAQIAWNTTTGPCQLAYEVAPGAFGPILAPWGTVGTQIAVYPIFFNKGVYFPPGMNAFMYYDPLLSAGSTISVTVYSASHTYMPVGVFPGSFQRSAGNTANASILMRYE